MFTMNFWFSMRGDLMPFTNWALALFVATSIGYLLYYSFYRSELKKSSYRKIYQAGQSFAFTNLLFALYIWFVMYQVVPYLSARVWFLFWFAEMFLWLMAIYKDLKKVPGLKLQNDGRQLLKKYIPK